MAWSVLKDPSNEATLRNGFSGGSLGAAPLSTSGTSQDAKCCEIGSLYSKVAAVFVGRTIGRRSPCKIGWTAWLSGKAVHEEDAIKWLWVLFR